MTKQLIDIIHKNINPSRLVGRVSRSEYSALLDDIIKAYQKTYPKEFELPSYDFHEFVGSLRLAASDYLHEYRNDIIGQERKEPDKIYEWHFREANNDIQQGFATQIDILRSKKVRINSGEEHTLRKVDRHINKAIMFICRMIADESKKAKAEQGELPKYKEWLKEAVEEARQSIELRIRKKAEEKRRGFVPEDLDVEEDEQQHGRIHRRAQHRRPSFAHR